MRRYKIYNAQLRLDIPKHFPGWIAGLKKTRIELELLQDLDMHLFIEDVVRGGNRNLHHRNSSCRSQPSRTQKAWLAPYIAFNTTKRQAAASPFERSFYKQLTA